MTTRGATSSIALPSSMTSTSITNPGACCRVIGAPFHLSTMHGRAVNAGAPAQELHVDYRRTTDGWPMVGFIFMWTSFGATTVPPDLCQVRTVCLISERREHDAAQTSRVRYRRAAPRARSSSTTAPCGTTWGELHDGTRRSIQAPTSVRGRQTSNEPSGSDAS